MENISKLTRDQTGRVNIFYLLILRELLLAFKQQVPQIISLLLPGCISASNDYELEPDPLGTCPVFVWSASKEYFFKGYKKKEYDVTETIYDPQSQNIYYLDLHRESFLSLN